MYNQNYSIVAVLFILFNIFFINSSFAQSVPGAIANFAVEEAGKKIAQDNLDYKKMPSSKSKSPDAAKNYDTIQETKTAGGETIKFTTTPTGWILCGLANMIGSYAGKGFATLAVIFLGIAASMGKITWQQAVMLVVGIASLLGAGSIVSYIIGDGKGCVFEDVAPDYALAKNPVNDALCHIAWALIGTTGKGMMTISVIIIGIGAAFQKISWNQAGILGVGIAMVFGSTALIANFTGATTNGCFDPTKIGPAGATSGTSAGATTTGTTKKTTSSSWDSFPSTSKTTGGGTPTPPTTDDTNSTGAVTPITPTGGIQTTTPLLDSTVAGRISDLPDPATGIPAPCTTTPPFLSGCPTHD